MGIIFSIASGYQDIDLPRKSVEEKGALTKGKDSQAIPCEDVSVSNTIWHHCRRFLSLPITKSIHQQSKPIPLPRNPQLMWLNNGDTLCLTK
jgi:hypothetical protein